ncbi:MAG TPA: hypothetical protein VKF62_08070 [Planctomycetota bacterium]|nr:hypothetical protein [Planctomycetota bacterium]
MRPEKSTVRDLRIWGLALAGALLLLAWLSRRRPVAGPVLAGLAVLLFAGGALAPGALRGPKALLDPIVARIGWLVTTLALLLFYLAAVTPVGWARRRRLREAFGLGARPGRASYWSPRPTAAEPMRHMDRQYT